MSVSYDCCVLSGKRSVLRDDHSSRGILPSLVCLSVIKKLHRSGWLGPLGLSRHGKRH
jgi:hypothetical protein